MIEIHHLTKTFSKHAVLDALTLSIARTDRIALVGSNGAGKTTLFRCILGHYNHGGDITIGGSPSVRRDPKALSRVAFVPQLPPPLHMPVNELLDFAVHTAGAAAVQMNEIAARLGLDLYKVRNLQFYRLSGGQKQKVLVTIALAREVDLMIFDEPTANLDPVARAAFIEMLAAKRDSAMLIASHRLEEVAPLVNRVIELDAGHVVLDDAVADRLHNNETFECVVGLREAHGPFVKVMKEWGFENSGDVRFTGRVPAAETFRFLSLMSRYGGIIAKFDMAGETGMVN